MKKVFKILGFTFLGVLMLIAGLLIFFNKKYNEAYEELKNTQENLSGSDGSFYRFELRKDSISELALLPLPKQFGWDRGEFNWPDKWETTSHLPKVSIWISRLFGDNRKEGVNTSDMDFLKNEDLPSEGYELIIRPNGVTIAYAEPVGAYYALVTLYHLKKQFPESIGCLTIRDQPDMAIRGLMYDISRDKVPQLHSLKEMIDKLSLLKYNHLELYVEGFSFGYPSFKGLWEGKETPITPEEIQELDAYCKERFIELVPNQNSLGHMQAWLETPEYEHLAECPDGYEIFPMKKVKTTLDPSNTESIQLVEKMMKDILPNFSSNKFNANLDEPFELGNCKNADLAEDVGVGQIYLDYVLKVYELAKSEGKELWMWGDIISKHPQLLDEMPKDITVLEWGYENEHPFYENTARIREKGLEFLVCPGTSSWMSLTGRTDNMLGNIENAVINGLENGAKGMLLTDWGDMGHWQYLPVSYPGFVFAGAVSWNSRTSRTLSLERYLNTYVFENENHGNLAGILIDMGRSYHFEERHMPNMSHIFMAYQFGMVDPVLEKTIYKAIEEKLPELVGDATVAVMEGRFSNQKLFDMDALNKHLSTLESDLNIHSTESTFVEKNREKSEVLSQIRNGIQMVRLGAEIRNYSMQKEGWTSAERIQYLDAMKNRLTDIQKEHRRLWLLKNKPGGLERSMQAFENLEIQIDDQLKIENGGTFGKKLNRLKEKAISGGVNWYLLD